MLDGPERFDFVILMKNGGFRLVKDPGLRIEREKEGGDGNNF